MTLRFRLVAGYAAFVSTTILLLLVGMKPLVEHTIVRQIREHHAVEAVEFVNMANETRPADLESRWIRHMELDGGLYGFALFSGRGRPVYRSPEFDRKSADELIRIPDGRADFGDGLGEALVTSHEVAGYKLRIITPLAGPLAIITRYYELGAVVFASGLMISLGAGWLFARWVLGPLSRMTALARAAEPDRPFTRIPEDICRRTDEVGRLARLLNEGNDRIEASVERLRRFSAKISHELRTPLSIVRLHAERIIRSDKSDEIARTLARSQIEEIERLVRFIGNLLVYARLDAGGVRMDIREGKVSEWLDDFSEDAVLLAEDAGLRFNVDGDLDATLAVDPVWMRQIFFNLLGNSLKVSPPGGAVNLRVRDAGACVVLAFEDEGPGVPADKLEAIFDRFVRYGEEKDSGGGVGLGLAICRAVVEQQGGRIGAANREDRPGLRITMEFPKSREQGVR